MVRPKKTYWRVNEGIQAQQLRVIGPDGKQLGVFSRQEALEKARELRADLVEIAPKAQPPVAKIIEFSKFKYQQDKKEREQKLKEKKGTEQKEIWLTPFIGSGDYETRTNRIKEFLEEGNKVRVIIKFTGRQMGHTEFGYQMVKRVEGDTASMAKLDGTPKFLGRQLMFTLSPVKGQGKENEENKTENQEISS